MTSTSPPATPFATLEVNVGTGWHRECIAHMRDLTVHRTCQVKRTITCARNIDEDAAASNRRNDACLRELVGVYHCRGSTDRIRPNL
jgi:hypothetical protein